MAAEPARVLGAASGGGDVIADLKTCELADQRDPVAGKTLLHGLAHAQWKANRLVGEEGPRLGPAEDGEAARLVQVGGDVGQELVVAEADRDVMEGSPSTLRASVASVAAALLRCRDWVSERSMNASSIESGSTNGLRSCIIARSSLPTAAYVFMPGVTTTASGQAFSALNIGMAERTPHVRATCQQAATTARWRPPTITGTSRSSGRSRFSIAAWNALQSRWAIARP